MLNAKHCLQYQISLAFPRQAKHEISDTKTTYY
jgi:hypothetical protein